MAFWKDIVSSEKTTSSKRVITLVISAHFIIASFVILFFAFNVVLKMPKGKIEPDLIYLLKQVLEYDFYVILAGLGFISAENVGQILLERAKAKIAGDVLRPPNINTDNIENVNIDNTDKSTTETTTEEPNDI